MDAIIEMNWTKYPAKKIEKTSCFVIELGHIDTIEKIVVSRKIWQKLTVRHPSGSFYPITVPYTMGFTHGYLWFDPFRIIQIIII